MTWGYQEYIDLYKAAWQLNHGLPAGAPPFRVVGLNVRQYWESLKTEQGPEGPAGRGARSSPTASPTRTWPR